MSEHQTTLCHICGEPENGPGSAFCSFPHKTTDEQWCPCGGPPCQTPAGHGCGLRPVEPLPPLQETTEPFSRKEVNAAAARLAANLRRFMAEGDQFISLSRRFALTDAALELEALADGR